MTPAGYYLLILDVDHDETLNDFGRKRNENNFEIMKPNIWVQHRNFPGQAIIINVDNEPFIAWFQEIDYYDVIVT